MKKPPPNEAPPPGPDVGPNERDRELLRYFVGRAWAEWLRNQWRERARR